MRWGTAFTFGVLLLAASTVGSEEDTKLRLCTGSPDGNYFASGQEIQRQLARQGVEVELVETDGSMDNMQRMAGGECDSGFAQIDAYLHYQDLNRESRLKVEWPRHLYEEYVHLVCRRDTGIESVQQLAKPTGGYSLAVGDPGSGSSITWDTMTRLRPAYLAVETQAVGTDSAIQSVRDGNSSCLLFVSGLRSDFLALIDASGEQLRLVSVDDQSFLDAKHFGRPIYQSGNIPKATYPNLQAPSGAPVESLAVRAVMLISSTWAGNHAVAHDMLIEGIKRAAPIIRKRVAAK